MSRNHAEIFALDGAFHVRDLGSTGATRVNGENIERRARALVTGDELQVGDVVLRYEIDGPA